MDVLSWPDSPCPHCPRVAAGLGLPCPAMARRNPRLCQLVDPCHPDHCPEYRSVVLGEREEPTPVEASRDAPSVAESLARIAAMKACPHWIRRTDCGCGNNGCALGKGAAGVVSHRDCWDCLDAGRIRPAG